LEFEKLQEISDLGFYSKLVNQRVEEKIMSGIVSWVILRRLHASFSMAREGRNIKLVVRVVRVREKE
jgi:hypothetical protein